MSDEVDLRTYIERIFDEREKAHSATFAAAMREAELKARELERRLEDLNHWKAEALTERQQFIRCEVYEEKHKRLEDRIETLQAWKSRVGGYVAGLVFASAVISSIVTILIDLLFKP